jgi:hypothetical protein
MLIWLILTVLVTCFFTVGAASLYWSMDKKPWRGLATAFSMAIVGVVMMLLFQVLHDRIEVGLLGKILYAFAMTQSIVQCAVALQKKRLFAASFD